MRSTPWHRAPIGDVETMIGSSADRGLPSAEARIRLRRFGPNRLAEAPGRSLAQVFIDQFREFMVMILIAAALVSVFLGEVLDAVVIMVIVVVNAVLGLIQEVKAERSLSALKQMAAPRAAVIRDGVRVEVRADEIVPGDVLLVESGTRVAADARIVSEAGLEVEESSLTGESVAVSKTSEPVKDDRAPVGDQLSMLFAGTTVVRGRGRALIVATGMATQMGMIAGLLSEPRSDKTPLQQRLEVLGRRLVAAAVVVVGLVVLAGLLRGEAPVMMLMAGVSLAVAAVPEGLPAVVTISLALGVQRMARRRAIVRRLPSVETLGCATVICTDKTGTLTVNEMTVREVVTGGGRWQVSGSGYEPSGDLRAGAGDAGSRADLRHALLAGVLCNNSRLVPPRPTGLLGRRRSGWQVQGDPTEGALLVVGAKGGLDQPELEGKLPRLAEIPFESDRRLMTVVVRSDRGEQVFSKGAPDRVLALCTDWLDGDGNAIPLDEETRQRFMAAAEDMGGRALRVLALAGRLLPAGTVRTADRVETGLTLYGLTGMIDPPRPEAAAAVARCHAAGIRVIMITGDHPSTAAAVAREVGIGGKRTVSGRDLDDMSPPELEAACRETTVFARVSPAHKLDIVRALRRLGHVVGMTGDGVNDAPAVREADIGISMGRTGTDVTRETSDIILADDNFATIVAAVEEGRGVYDNIRRFIRYLLSCNVGEIVVMFAATLVGLPLPLLPAQILLLNLVTDGLPATALGIETPDPDVMQRKPRDPRAGIFADGMVPQILFRGVLIGMVALAAFWLGLVESQDLGRARTIAFATLVLSQLIFAFMVRGGDQRGFRRLTGNLYLLGAVLSSFAVLLAVVYIPILRPAFRTEALMALDWVVVVVGSLIAAVATWLPGGRASAEA